MKKVTLIGDCHSARVYEYWNPNSCSVKFQAWGRGGTNSWMNDPAKMSEINDLSSGTERGNEFYLGDQNDLKLNFSKIVDQDLILVWLGYVDIRQMLPKHKNADFTVKQYMDRFIEHFKNSKVRFIEPLPQFKQNIMKYDELHAIYSYEERLEQNNEFVKSLRKYSDEYGLDKPVSQDQICNAVGLTFDDFTEDKTPNYAPHPLDTLKPEYMKKIYDLIIKEAQK